MPANPHSLAPSQYEQFQAQREERAQEKSVGREESPTARKPYLAVNTGHMAGPNVAAPGQSVRLDGRGYHAGSIVEIAVDGKTLKKVKVEKGGRFSATVEAPRQLGMHNITIIDEASAKVIDGAMLLVRPEDKDGEERKRR